MFLQSEKYGILLRDNEYPKMRFAAIYFPLCNFCVGVNH